jgi:hypothetical protein
MSTGVRTVDKLDLVRGNGDTDGLVGVELGREEAAHRGRLGHAVTARGSLQYQSRPFRGEEKGNRKERTSQRTPE